MNKRLPVILKKLVILMIVLAVICILILIGAHFFEYSSAIAFIIAGVICMAVGLASFNGNGQLKRSEGLAQVASIKNEPADSKKYFRDLGYGFLIFMFILGALLIGISILV